MGAATLAVVSGIAVAGSPAMADGCSGSELNDYDGDQIPDVVIGDWGAPINGVPSAGRIDIRYGDGGAGAIDLADVANGELTNERFGHSLASTDWNLDGCADLFVGAPGYPGNPVNSHGAVYLVYGSPSGLDPVTVEVFRQGDGFIPDTAELDDRFGLALAAGVDFKGKPFAVVGTPNEDVGELADAGMVTVIKADDTEVITQDTEGVKGVSESGDEFGWSVAATETNIAVGSPGEAIGGVDDAGMVHTFAFDAIDRRSSLDQTISQERSRVSGVAERADRFGESLATVDLRANDPWLDPFTTMLAVGVPYENIGGNADAGMAHVFMFGYLGVSELSTVHQDIKGVSGAGEARDRFGLTLAFQQNEPNTRGEAVLAVGTPLEGVGNRSNRGMIQLFTDMEKPGDGDLNIMPQLEAAGADLVNGTAYGLRLHATDRSLYLVRGDFDDECGCAEPFVHAAPFENLLQQTEFTLGTMRPTVGVDYTTWSRAGFGDAVV